MGGCIFCEIVRAEAPSWRVYEHEYPEWRARFDDMVSKLRDAGATEAGRRGKDVDLDSLLRGIPY